MLLTDQWIVGFVDGDGCFKIVDTPTGKRYCFVVSQDARSVSVLYALKSKFGCGSVNKAGNRMREYRVSKKEHLINIILPFFLKNPLKTEKMKDFLILYQELMGTQPNDLKKESGSDRDKTKICRDWLTGFIDAEANFYVSMVKDYPRPQFSIGLHLRDEQVLNHIKDFMGCGIVYKKKQKKGFFINYQISNQQGFESIIKLCTTSTNRCLLKTIKRISFLKFKQIVKMILEKKHLTSDGINRIKKILSKTNQNN